MADNTGTGAAGALLARYEKLQDLRLNTDSEIVAIERGLRMAGLLAKHGRPEVAPTHTIQQCRESHAAYQRGDRDEWTVLGERQYQRERKREERIRATGPDPDSLVWTCDQCHSPIADGEGAIWVDHAEYHAYETALRLWESAHPPDEAHTLGDILNKPTLPQWKTTHRDCSGDETELYWLAVEKIRTPRQLLGTTAHMIGKSWLPNTGWQQVLERAARSGS